MPAKPRHKRGKLSPQARRRREEMRGPTAETAGATATAPTTATAPQARPALAQTPAAQSAAVRPSARPAKGTAPAPNALQIISHQQVGSELRAIGIITAVLVVILVVLSFVIH